MRKSLKINLIKLALVGFVACLALFVGFVPKSTATASEHTFEVTSTTIRNGSESDEFVGLQFNVSISDSIVENKSISKLGAIIFPSANANAFNEKESVDQNLTLVDGVDTQVDVSLRNYSSSLVFDYQTIASFMQGATEEDIQIKLYSLISAEFTCTPYAIIGGETIYGQSSQTSMALVASKFMDDEVLGEVAKSFFANVMDDETLGQIGISVAIDSDGALTAPFQFNSQICKTVYLNGEKVDVIIGNPTGLSFYEEDLVDYRGQNVKVEIFGLGSYISLTVPVEEKVIVNTNEVTEEKWNKAFEFENVTVTYGVKNSGNSVIFKFDEKHVNFAPAFEVEDFEPMSIMRSDELMMSFIQGIYKAFDYTGLYDSAIYGDGKYYIEEATLKIPTMSFDPETYQPITIYEDKIIRNAYISFIGDNLYKIEVDEVDFIYEDYETGEPLETPIENVTSTVCTFTDHNVTDATIDLDFSVSQTEWEEICESIDLSNVMMDYEHTSWYDVYENDVLIETVQSSESMRGYVANNVEKWVPQYETHEDLEFLPVELYNISGMRYRYWLESYNYNEKDYVAGEVECLGVAENVVGNLELTLSQLGSAYGSGQLTYDSETDSYALEVAGEVFKIAIANGKISKVIVTTPLEGGYEAVSIFEFNAFDSISFTVPFEI